MQSLVSHRRNDLFFAFSFFTYSGGHSIFGHRSSSSGYGSFTLMEILLYKNLPNKILDMFSPTCDSMTISITTC